MLVLEPVELLAVDVGELDPVAGVVDLQVEHRPDQREAALLARESSDHLRPSLHLAERALEQIGRAPAFAVPQRVAHVDDERLEVVGEASRRGRIAGSFELRDEGAESLPCVALIVGLVERLPVGAAHALAILLGSFAIRLRARWTEQCWRSEAGQHCSTALIRPGAPSATTSIGAPSPRAIRSLARPSQSSCDSRIPRQIPTRTRSPSSVNPQAHSTPSFGPLGLTLRKIASRNRATSLTW